MIDLVPLIDAIGENGAALAIGLAAGLAFGVFAQRSAFCTRSAVIAVSRGRNLSTAATWAIGFAVAVLLVQYAISADILNVAETRFFATAQSLSGALIGGGLFGLGMVLARGCVSRHLVLAASGNLRALFTTVIIAVAGLATYGGVLVPLRDAIGGIANTSAIGGNDLLAHVSFPQTAGVVIGAALLIGAIILGFASRTSVWKMLGGAGVGLAVVGGWIAMYALSTQVFEPIQAESLSFIRPLATTGEIVLGAEGFSFDQGVLIGVLAGALIAALAFGEFRIQTFSEPGTPSIWRYALGAVLMGFGGILAVGCTIGAGFTGGSVLAVSSLVGLASMMAGAAIADRLIDGKPQQVAATPEAALHVPAE